MKKSVYKTTRMSVHRLRMTEYMHEVDALESWAILKTENDVDAAEAAGVVWDPEESSLPQAIYCAPAFDCQGPFNAHLYPVNSLHSYQSPVEMFELYREAVRRYNAWPDLEKRATLRGGSR